MKSTLLVLFLFTARVGASQDLQDLKTQAQKAVSEKRFAEALRLYRSACGASTADVDCDVWIAKLSAWTGDYSGAATSYSQALASDPKNVDAMVGKANVLMWQHSFEEALGLLTEARELAPSNVDVELAWSRYYHWQGDDKDASLYLDKCLAADGANQEARQLKESLVPDHSIELRIAYEGDTFPGTNLGAIEQIDVSYIDRKGNIGIDFAHLDLFGQAASRGGLHFSRKIDSAITIRMAGLVGGGSDIVAKLDLSTGISRSMGHGFVLGADYRYIAFQDLKVNAAIGSLEYYFEKPIWLVASYGENRVGNETTPAYLIRFNARIARPLTLNVGYAHGTEVFQLALPTDFGNFTRDSYIGGAAFAFTKKTRTEATYMFSRRSTGALENMFLLALVHRL
jgi:YaiO family outer membrane protein